MPSVIFQESKTYYFFWPEEETGGNNMREKWLPSFGTKRSPFVYLALYSKGKIIYVANMFVLQSMVLPLLLQGLSSKLIT